MDLAAQLRDNGAAARCVTSEGSNAHERQHAAKGLINALLHKGHGECEQPSLQEFDR